MTFAHQNFHINSHGFALKICQLMQIVLFYEIDLCVLEFPFIETFCKCVNGENPVAINKHNREDIFVTIK